MLAFIPSLRSKNRPNGVWPKSNNIYMMLDCRKSIYRACSRSPYFPSLSWPFACDAGASPRLPDARRCVLLFRLRHIVFELSITMKRWDEAQHIYGHHMHYQTESQTDEMCFSNSRGTRSQHTHTALTHIQRTTTFTTYFVLKSSAIKHNLYLSNTVEVNRIEFGREKRMPRKTHQWGRTRGGNKASTARVYCIQHTSLHNFYNITYFFVIFVSMWNVVRIGHDNDNGDVELSKRNKLYIMMIYAVCNMYGRTAFGRRSDGVEWNAWFGFHS